MIIALPIESDAKNASVSEHFGRSPYFYIFNSQENLGKIYQNKHIEEHGGVGVKTSQMMLDHAVQILISPRVGGKSLDVLNAGGIHIYESVKGTAEENIKRYLNGQLKKLF